LQNLVSTLAARFGGEDPRFAFSDASSLTADSGPVTAAALRALGVLQLSPELASKVDAGQELPPGKMITSKVRGFNWYSCQVGEAVHEGRE